MRINYNDQYIQDIHNINIYIAFILQATSGKIC